MSPDQLSGTAFSYIRFSSAEQERGDSLRRQRELRDKWLGRHPDVTLDTPQSLEDLGVSGYRVRHRSDKHALGQFLDAVRRGRVERGSILLLENLDRLSREVAPAKTWPFSFVVPPDVDLRNRADAAELEKALAKVEPAAFFGAS